MMSNRSMLEFNHDKYPYPETPEVVLEWANKLLTYIRSGDPAHLPLGVTFFNIRHHSEDCPLGEPPYGWQNDHRTEAPNVKE